jgi:hypothetical protein
VFYVCRLHSWRWEKWRRFVSLVLKWGCSISLVLEDKFGSLSLLFFWFFMTSCGYMAPIGALDYGRMRNCSYLKDGSFATRGLFAGFWNRYIKS